MENLDQALAAMGASELRSCLGDLVIALHNRDMREALQVLDNWDLDKETLESENDE